MCGIFGYVGHRDDASEIVLNGLKQLEYRGYDSWGVAFLPKKLKDREPTFVVEKHVGKIGAAKVHEKEPSSFAIGHTRWATHGGVTVPNSHPHLNEAKTIALAHNGIVENYQILKKRLIKKGYAFISETDTEVIVHLIDDVLKKFPFQQAVQKAFLQLEGLNAFAVINTTTREMIAIRKGSPLALGLAKDGYYIASDPTALTSHTSSVYFFEDDDMVVCNSTSARVFHVRNGKEKRVGWQKLDFTPQDLTKGLFNHYMLKEIMEQPRVLSTIGDSLTAQIKEYAKNLKNECIFLACGSAYYASLAGMYLFSIIANKRVTAVIGSEFRYVFKFVKKSGAFVSFVSQSGETIDIVEHAQTLNKQKVAFGAVINRLGSTLERMTHLKILLGAGPEQCVLATKSFTAQLAVMFLLAHRVAGTFRQGQEELRKGSQKITAVLTANYLKKYIEPLAKRLVKSRNIFVVGRGLSYPIALEASLKIKEVTYIHAEGFAGGDLKHGVIALIEKGSPCLIFAPHDETYPEMLSNAMEMKSRGAYIIGISDKSNDIFDALIPIENVGICSMLAESIAIQLLAYRMALLLGNDPDKPRNIAKSVTVK